MPPQNTNQIDQDNQIPPTVNKKKWGMITAGVVLLIIIIFGVYLFINNKSPVKPPTNLCSSYFGVCVANADNKWATTTDARSDFDLQNNEENILLAFIYSSTLTFKDPDPGFTTVTLLGQTRQVYKDATSTLTRVITGVNSTNSQSATSSQSIIILLASDKDISADKVKEIVGKIKLPTL